ncbi:MAG: patatin-like phospholipase family protein [Myxococcota bacterium]
MVQEPVGLVLSGGGARGAYEAGVVAGITEILGGGRPSPFNVFSGTSVGAINAGWLAAHADRGDMGIDELVKQWCGLNLDAHLNLDPLGMLGLQSGPFRKRERGSHYGRSLLNPEVLERLVFSAVDWERLHRNVDSGKVQALLVAALHIATGQTTIFAELTKGMQFRGSSDPRRRSRCELIRAEHVLASAALPLLFPSRRIGPHYYCDGGLRFNTPISPALRCGAEKLVVITLQHQDDRGGGARLNSERLAQYPSPLFLLGKVLNALMLDQVSYDLQVLDRLNKLISVLEAELEPQELAKVEQVLCETRGLPYRRIRTLVFEPSESIANIASRFAERIRVRGLSTLLVRQFAKYEDALESDVLSYLLFDGTFAEQLISLGKRDVWNRRDEVYSFFDSSKTVNK